MIFWHPQTINHPPRPSKKAFLDLLIFYPVQTPDRPLGGPWAMGGPERAVLKKTKESHPLRTTLPPVRQGGPRNHHLDSDMFTPGGGGGMGSIEGLLRYFPPFHFQDHSKNFFQKLHPDSQNRPKKLGGSRSYLGRSFLLPVYQSQDARVISHA